MLGFCQARNVMQHQEVVIRIREASDAFRQEGWSEEEVIDALVDMGFLGIVANNEEQSPVYRAIFAYLSGDRIQYTRKSVFAIHPMFYGHLQIEPESGRYVYPYTYAEEEL